MKTNLKVAAAITGLGLVILLGLHLFLQYGLTQTMREVVLPRMKAETGIDARVGRLSINLPNGVFYLNDVVVKNPNGFLLENLVSIERIRLEIDLFSLLKKQPIRVKSLEVEHALLNVVRNQEGEINLNAWQPTPLPIEPLPRSRQPPQERVPDRRRVDPSPVPERAAEKPLPEVLIKSLYLRAKVRYVDLKLNALDGTLDLGVTGQNLSTQRDSSLPWGELAVMGSIGNQGTSFMTDLRIRLAPLADLQAPSFDLTGQIMKIDPRLMAEAYSKLGIRSAPFGLDPTIQCRDGWFQNSEIVVTLEDIVLEDKLARRLGGMAAIGSLRFPVPIEGSLQEPTVDLQRALSSAIRGNAGTLLHSCLKGFVAKESGLEEPPADLTDAVVEALAVEIEEIGKSEVLQIALKDLANGTASDTNATDPISSDALIHILGEHIEVIGENEELKDELKNLSKWLFGQ